MFIEAGCLLHSEYTMSKVLALVFFFSLSSFGGDSFDRQKVFTFDTGIPLVATVSCSGAIVRSNTAWQGNSFFVTASHCQYLTHLIKDKTAHNSGGFMGLRASSPASVNFTWENSNHSYSQDILVAPISDKSFNAEVIHVAQKLPAVGSPITIAGYPGKGVPLFVMVNVFQKMDCIYKGPVLAASAVRAIYGRATILHFALCNKRTFIAGMSGGPVQDSVGNYIGTISQGAQDILDRSDRETTSIIYFGELTEESLSLVNANPEKSISDETVKARDQVVLVEKIENISGTSVLSYEESQLRYSLKNGLIDGIVNCLSPKDLCRDEYFAEGLRMNVWDDQKAFRRQD